MLPPCLPCLSGKSLHFDQAKSPLHKITLLLIVLTLLPGCGGSDSPFDYLPVTGKLSYEDGTPIPAGGIKLIFESQAPPVGDAYPRPGSVNIGRDGSFKDVTSYKYGDGLTPGKHKVTILYANDAEGNLLIPRDYVNGTTTPLVIDTANLPLAIKVPRP